jgi:aspartate/methionine/tyrosine aminotransferase
LVEPALERLEVIADTYLSMSAPIQHAIPEFLKFRTTFQAQLMERLRTNLSELDRQLNCQKTLTRLALDGGWYATVRVPVTRSDEQLAIALLEETGVLTHPGHFFDFVSDGYLVLSLMTPEREFAEGVARLMRFFEAI